MAKKCPYNPQKCTLASLHSSCIHQYLCKVIISLPTKPKIVDVFEKTLIAGCSCVNTLLAFDTSILLPRDQNGDRKKDLNMIYRIRNKENNYHEDKGVVGKILKIDENNQYGNVMTKPLPTGCIKKLKKTPTLRDFILLIKGILHHDKIGHLFVVNIEFNEIKCYPKTTPL